METITNEIFRPRLPPIWVAAVDTPPQRRRNVPISGLASLLSQCTPDPNFVPTKSIAQLQETRKRDKKKLHDESLARGKQEFKSCANEKHMGPVTNVLFVARLKYTVTEEQLQEYFKQYGTVERVRIVYDLNKASRGYGFILFDTPRGVSRAIQGSNNALLHGSRIMVDNCRCIDRNWLPMRLGGGLGGRKAKVIPEPEPRFSTRITPRRGGFTGGFIPKSRHSTPYDRPAKGRPQRGGRGGSDTSRRGRGGHNQQRNFDNRQDRPPNSRPHPPQPTRHSRYIQDFDGPRDMRDMRDPRDMRDSRNPRDTSRDSSRDSTQDMRAPVDPKSGGRTLRKY